MKSWTTFVISILFSFSVFAEGPCKSDVEKFCAGLAPGGGAIVKCLREHESELSAECKARGEEMKERFQQAREACTEDVTKFCSAVKPGGKSVLKCLKKNKKNLSQACRESVSRKK